MMTVVAVGEMDLRRRLRGGDMNGNWSDDRREEQRLVGGGGR
jgi:hypothetical protein